MKGTKRAKKIKWTGSVRLTVIELNGKMRFAR